MEYLGEYVNYHVYRNSDGFLEGYMKTGKNIIQRSDNNGHVVDWNAGKDLKRIVTNATTPNGFIEYVNGMKPKKGIKDTPLKPHQLPTLFKDE